MKYKRFEQKIPLRLNPGEEITGYIREVCKTEKVVSGEVSGLGAAPRVELGVFDIAKKKYYGKSFKDNYEITPLIGSIAQQGGNPYFHLYMVIDNPSVGECHGGHLNGVVINAIVEIFIVVTDGAAGRRMNEPIELNLIEFTQA